MDGKSKQTYRSFNLIVNYRKQILYTTSGHPARRNDQTIVLFDDFAYDLRNGKIMQDNIFELLQHNSDDGVVYEVKYRGVWMLVDNDDLNWGTAIHPMKQTIVKDVSRWSEWLKSMRKDLGCTCEILKGRFCVIRSDIRLHGADVADNI